jgi:hypothetical protein
MNYELKFCVYKTTHPTGFYYFGKGITKKVILGTYKGSGIKLKLCWLNNYPYEEWTSEVLATFGDDKTAYRYEAAIITYEILADPYCLNVAKGGHGGWTYKSSLKRSLNISKALKGKKRGPQKKSTIDKRTKTLRSEEVQTKITNTKTKNGSMGYVHIYNITTQEVKKITKSEQIPEGWTKGKTPKKQRTEEEKEEAKRSGHKKSSEIQLGKKWYHDPMSKEQKFCHPEDKPYNFILGRCDEIGFGAKNAMAKKCIVDGIEFESKIEAQHYFNEPTKYALHKNHTIVVP